MVRPYRSVGFGLGLILLGPAAGCRTSDPARTVTSAPAPASGPAYLVAQGEARLAEGKPLEAYELALRANKEDPNLAGAHHLMALVYAEAQQVEKARGKFAEAVRLAPNLAAPRLNHARFELALGEPIRALQELQELVRRDPKNAEAWQLIGEAQYRRGSPQKAAASYRRAIELNPDLPAAHAGLGLLELDLGHYGQATPPLEEAYRLGDRSPVTLCYLALALLTGSPSGTTRERAESLLKEAGNPQIPPALFARGLIARGKGDLPGAEAAFRQVLRNEPRHERALYALHEVQRSRRDTRAAVATLKQYHQIVKDRQRLTTLTERLNSEGPKPELLKEYALTLARTGRKREAEAQFRAWAEREPKDPEPKRWLQRLAAENTGKGAP